MFNPTKQQSCAINACPGVLVTAAAGSGKTAVLVERVVGMICRRENPTSLDRLLIVTFTNAAAAEMRQRIEKRLYEEAKRNPQDKRIARQMLLLSSAQICTIDSFCINLVRDNFSALGISPDFKICETNVLHPLYSAAVDAVLTDYYSNRTGEITALISSFGAEYGDSCLTEAVEKLFEFSRTMPYPDDWLKYCAGLYDDDNESLWANTVTQSALSQLNKAASRLSQASTAAKDNDKLQQKYGEVLSRAKIELDAIISAAGTDSQKATELCKEFEFPILYGFAKDTTAGTVRRARTMVLDAVKNYINCGLYDPLATQDREFTAPLCRTLIEITLAFSAKLSELMTEKNILTFYNTEQLALELLTEKQDGEIKESVRAKQLSSEFDEVLVDEYQDVNDLQDRLFRLLSDDGRKLFAVGDVKQSIYGFRGANPENFVQKQETSVPVSNAREDDCKRVVLSSNFRSREGVCRFINYYFSLIMSRNLGGVDYGEDEMLNAAAQFPENKCADTELHLVSADEESDSAAVTEARHIARYIKETIAGPCFIKKDEGLRKAEYSDFAILLRSPKGSTDIYLEEFKKAGIPIVCDSGGFSQSREVEIMMSLLKVINNPTHDVPLLSLMLSPIFAFTTDEVAKIRIQNRKSSLYAALVLSAQRGSRHAADFLDTIKKYRTMAVTMSVDRLISRLYDETGLLDTVLAMDGGQRRRNNLLLLQSRAAGFESDRRGVSQFIAYMEKTGDGMAGANDSTSGNAVKIMSIHASKGLQFPVCIIAGCYKRFNDIDARNSLVFDRRLGVAFKAADRSQNRRVETLARRAIVANIKRDSLSEELRLMYVAMTRAEERLVLLLTDKNPLKKVCDIAKRINDGDDAVIVEKAGHYSDWFIFAALKCGEADELRRLAGVDIQDIKPAGCRIKFVSDNVCDAVSDKQVECQTSEPDKNVVAAISERFSYVYPYSGLMAVASKTSVSDIVHGKNRSGYTARPAFLSSTGFTPAQRGTLTHKFMQYADYNAAETDLKGELDRLVSEEFLTRAEADAIDCSTLERFFAGSVYRLIKYADEVHRELRFITEVPVCSLYPEIKFSEDEKVVVQGIMDCIIEKDNDLIVLDFKTDRVGTTAELAEMYSVQLNIYASACEKLFARHVTRKIIYSFALDDIIEV